MNSDAYKTINNKATGLYKDKGSKFISFAFEVASENEIKKHIDDIKKEYFDARHHCYAYALGANRAIYRTFDDGEPSGTAGKPIFGQIQAFNLTNILIVIVRYFGGTLLGTGGLIQAYKNAANNALCNSSIVEKTFNQIISIHFNYLVSNQIMKIVKDYNLKPLNPKFENNSSIMLEIRKSLVSEITEKVLEIENTWVE